MTQHELHQAAEALQHIRLTDIRHNSTDDAQRLAALRSKYSNAVFDVIPSGHQFAISSDVFSFAIRHRLGLNLGIRAVFRAVSRDSRRARRSAAPPSAKFPHKFYAHNHRNTARRAARMNDRVA